MAVLIRSKNWKPNAEKWILQFNNYEYRNDSINEHNGNVYWRCVEDFCKGRAITDGFEQPGNVNVNISGTVSSVCYHLSYLGTRRPHLRRFRCQV